ncbi:dienelactone hydrolase family protein [Asticcacaulis sp. EMRT-3]|uniref:dienelactone hydrolase family protein n=1 Tax=Asticcacaulis sp. EMRT-3 TaxID=3040349 RepID=UPI0024AF25F0|nr:dienelactone hydrolase family protein [Asticcacaulis sp. EMRT-3]MDI7775974.1 dienelactone hydrolase family protein [Asticcacaulis sp. EMRT-3]
MLDSLAHRFSMLEPAIRAYGPDDDQPRPAVLLFHACNGVREHIHAYAMQAAALGYRAYVVDSFGPRGWDHQAAMNLVCTGLALHGYERSGDVLAALWGLGQRPEVDAGRLVVAGWSHGGWAIMDLMTERLTREGEARLKDPTPEAMQGVKGVFLVYPYINFPARSNSHAWVHRPKTLAILARQDFLTGHSHAEHILNHLRSEGVPVEMQVMEATHCFDEDSALHFGPLMAYDRPSHTATEAAFAGFLAEVLGAET